MEGQFLCPAEIWVKFLISQEGTCRLVLSTMEGQNLELGKTWIIKKEHQSDALSPVQYVTAEAEVQQHSCKEYERKIELQTSTFHILAYWH